MSLLYEYLEQTRALMERQEQPAKPFTGLTDDQAQAVDDSGAWLDCYDSDNALEAV